MNWEHTAPRPIPSRTEIPPIRRVSAKNSRAMVRCSIPRTASRANSFWRLWSIYRLTNRIRNNKSRVTVQMATFIPSLRMVKWYSTPMSGL